MLKEGLPPIKQRDKIDGTRLISEWCTVAIEKNGVTIEVSAYYHVFHGWMVKGDIDDVWKFGYRPIDTEVLGWY